MTRECLIIFTRYPEPGKTKTRLIPMVGAEGAAKLHCLMAEHTLLQVRKLQNERQLSVEVHFVGGTPQLIQDWLGSDIVYHQQRGDDLGSRSCLSSGCSSRSAGSLLPEFPPLKV